uniref:Predicted nuclease of the RNAse H fold, HicB family n=1 Tax=uncultured Thiotrichaceae bacterium TaxID=298394 RepID=A0A6S6SHU6_9GAMM|nr:MAG: Predicted nuclease of the RNAse H fold, HicB family [uncultured Thiotrichaceae bacterium]
MINTMEFDGFNAVIKYDPEIEMFRGEFTGLKGGADFYASDIDGLKKEGATSLRIFLESCKERGIEPRKNYSGKFNVRIAPDLHADIATAATAQGKSLNQWVSETLNQAVA